MADMKVVAENGPDGAFNPSLLSNLVAFAKVGIPQNTCFPEFSCFFFRHKQNCPFFWLFASLLVSLLQLEEALANTPSPIRL